MMSTSRFELSHIMSSGQTFGGETIPDLGIINRSLLGSDGRVIATSSVGLAAGAEATLEAIRRSAGVSLEAGDMVVTNDSDVGTVSPCELAVVQSVPTDGTRAFLLIRGRIPDLGGWELGGYSVQAGDRWAEGARIVPVALQRAGRERREIVDIFRLNSRTPGLTIAAIRELATRLQVSSKQCAADWANLQSQIAKAFAEETTAISAALADLAPGEARKAVVPGWTKQDVGAIRVAAEPTDSRLLIRIDAPNLSALPINLSRPAASGIATAAVAFAIKRETLKTRAILDQVTIECLEGSLVSARLPVCMGLGWHTTGRALFEATALSLGADADITEQAWHRFAASTAPGALDEGSGRITDAADAALRKLEANEAAA